MADGVALKVALLARAGDAREQLRRAITELGADLVVESDPNDLAPGALGAAGATTVLVSVEPAVEAALDRLDDELLSPGLTVMYDEAETTAKLTGWDQARWARHLAAKLLGCDVLPPGAEPEAHQEAADHLEPGVPTTPAALAADARIADFADEASASASAVPSAYAPGGADAGLAEDGGALPPEPAPAPAPWASAPVVEGDPVTLDLDLAAVEQAMASAVVELPEEPAIDPGLLRFDLDGPPEAAERPAVGGVSLLAAREIDLGAAAVGPGADAGAAMDVEEISLTEAELAAFGEGAGFRFTAAADEATADAADDLEMDPELAKLAASFDENLESVAFEPAADEFAADFADDFADFDRREAAAEASRPKPEPPSAPDFGFADGAYVEARKPAAAPLPDVSGLSLSDEAVAAPAPAAGASKPAFDFGALDGLSLAPIDDVPAVSPPPAVAAVPPPALDVGHLSLSPLADEGGAPAEAGGTVLVLSGIGGPDAVRQLVRALPAGFPLSVLLQQNLDGGRHDRFVEQLAKISRLPVALAEPTETPPLNAVRVLPEGLSSAGALSFPREGGVAALVAAATARDGAVVVLSGADEAAIEPLKAALAAGVRVLVQDPASCFDGKVAAALREAGAASMPAADLAARLDAHFPT